MNPFNHFLASFNVLLILFHNTASIGEILLFSLVFGTLLDLDEIVGTLQKKSKYNLRNESFKELDKGDLRTWIHEPFGFIIVGITLGILFAIFLKPYYFLLIIIPYALHIIMDYLTIHKAASPLAPFSKKTIKTGFIRPVPAPNWFKRKKGFSENYVLILNLFITIILLLIYL